MVALKIIQHCRQNIPLRVTGQLLGLDVNGVLDITNSFMVPPRSEDEKDGEYELKMLHHLREVNVDNISVGWYISTFLGQHHELPDMKSQDTLPFLVNTQFGWQKDLPNSVVLIYDHLATSHGSLSLRAFRLTKAFIDLYKGKERNFTRESLSKNGFSFRNIFEELPVKISSGGISNALLTYLEGEESVSDQFESLDLGSNEFLEKNLELLLHSFSDLQSRNMAYQSYLKLIQRNENTQQALLQKRKAENASRQLKGLEPLSENLKDLEGENPSAFRKIAEPWRPNLDSLLLYNRIDEHCQQISAFAAKAMVKDYVANLTEPKNGN
uniref:MPN domain-containing protein n=1 Tax=Arcella intermedia TaxID=1963864 RepID=A0A6B2L947_9EUKA